MTQYDPKKIEELQLTLLKNPRSPLFGALADAYRSMGLLEEALEVTTKGVKHNPEYVSGLVAHARILYELKDFRAALKFLKKAHALKPENLLALRLLAHCYIKLRDHRNALYSFKKLLIHSPADEVAQKFIKKWEFLANIKFENAGDDFTFDGYDEWVRQLENEDQVIHLIDSFINHGDKKVALEIATTALLHWSDSDDIKRRQELLLEDVGDDEDAPAPPPETDNPALQYLQAKKEIYQNWLRRIEQLKTIDP